MQIPGFTAEKLLYEASRSGRQAAAFKSALVGHGSTIYPQQLWRPVFMGTRAAPASRTPLAIHQLAIGRPAGGVVILVNSATQTHTTGSAAGAGAVVSEAVALQKDAGGLSSNSVRGTF